jgi:hypothetical protein
VDAFVKTTHLASRSELDEAYLRIYELRKDVKELKKSLQAIKAEFSTQVNKQTDGAIPADLPKDIA